MIQRVQTIYLLIATILMLLFYIFPIAIFTTDTFSFEFFNCHLTHPENLEPPITLLPLAILPSLSIVISFVSIFLYKKRKLQMRLGKINLLLIFTITVVTILYFLKLSELLNGSVQYGFSGIFPVLAFIITAMGISAINKDEKLVKSIDRIR